MTNYLDLDSLESGHLHFKSVLALQLDEVMETETYKNAKMILERFDPDSRKKNVSCSFQLFNISPFLLVCWICVVYF